APEPTRLPYTTLFRSLAEPAEGAGVERHALGVGVGLAQVARGLRKRMVPERFGGAAEECGAVGLLLRRRRILARARILERIAARSEEHTSELQSRENL